MSITAKHPRRGLELSETKGWRFSPVPFCDCTLAWAGGRANECTDVSWPFSLLNLWPVGKCVWFLFWHRNFQTIRIISCLYSCPPPPHGASYPCPGPSLHLLWSSLHLLSEQNSLVSKPTKELFCLIGKGTGCQICSQTQDRMTMCLFTFLGEEPKSLK